MLNKTDGPVRLSYETAGDSGSPVLLIMGFGMPGRSWMSQVPALSQRHRIAWYDNRGVGDSDAPEGFYTMREMAGDAVRLLDHLGWQSAHVVGVSMGGMIAQEVALRQRARVRSLTLIATHAGGLLALLPPWRGLGLVLGSQRGTEQERVEKLSRLLYTESFQLSPEIELLKAQMLENVASAKAARGRVSQFAAIARHRTSGRLAQLTGLPTLILRPDRDRLIRPSQSDRLKKLMPHAQLRSVANGGHGVIRECATTINEALLEHFAVADRGSRDSHVPSAANERHRPVSVAAHADPV